MKTAHSARIEKPIRVPKKIRKANRKLWGDEAHTHLGAWAATMENAIACGDNVAGVQGHLRFMEKVNESLLSMLKDKCVKTVMLSQNPAASAAM